MLHFADDNVILVEDELDIRCMFRKLSDEYMKRDLEIRVSKPEYLVVGGGELRPRVEQMV